MNKKKANICTLLLAIVWMAVLVGSWFIETADGTYRLYYTITAWMAGWFMFDRLDRFRNWLMKSD